MESILAITALVLLGQIQGGSFTRNAQSSNKRPRDVETVDRFDYLRRGRLHHSQVDVDEPDVVSTVHGNLIDIDPHPLTHKATDYARWTQWSDWSACSRTCGSGISFRERKCISRFAAVDNERCEGESTENKLCFTEDCPPGSEDFLELQCSQQNGKLFHDRNFKWVPYFGKDGNTCELTCMASNHQFYHSFGQAFDGTRCGPQGKGICVRGECVKVGCDEALNSIAVEDACGVCGGNNDTCFRYQNVVDRLADGDLTVGYKKIATIPIGASHIQVKDYNENFLALLEVGIDNEKYIINGHWIVSWTGQFKAAGTVGTYGREGNKETFEIVGPTEKELKIMILIIDQQQPLVQYEYWISKNESKNYPTAEFKEQKMTIIRMETEDDYLNQIIAAGLSFDDVSVPTMSPYTVASTTTSSPRTATTTTSSPTTTTTISTTTTKSYKYGTKKPNPSCTSCRKGINKKKHYCESDFTFHIRVLPRRHLRRRSYVRYTVEILNSYKSNVKVLRREYIWLPISCCPRLRPNKHYLVMGRAAKISSNAIEENLSQKMYRSPFLVDEVIYWYSWRKYQYKMARMAKRLNCKRFKSNAVKHYRKKLSEG